MTYLSTSTGTLYFSPVARVHEYRFTADEIATCLSRMCRFNGHMGADTVAGHSVRVWEALADRDPFTRAAGLLHDAAEAYVGDMPGPLKRTVWHEGCAEIEAEIQAAIHAQLLGVLDFEARVDWSAVREADAADAAATMAYRWRVPLVYGWRNVWLGALEQSREGVARGR